MGVSASRDGHVSTLEKGFPIPRTFIHSASWPVSWAAVMTLDLPDPKSKRTETGYEKRAEKTYNQLDVPFNGIKKIAASFCAISKYVRRDSIQDCGYN